MLFFTKVTTRTTEHKKEKRKRDWVRRAVQVIIAALQITASLSHAHLYCCRQSQQVLLQDWWRHTCYYVRVTAKLQGLLHCEGAAAGDSDHHCRPRLSPYRQPTERTKFLPMITQDLGRGGRVKWLSLALLLLLSLEKEVNLCISSTHQAGRPLNHITWQSKTLPSPLSMLMIQDLIYILIQLAQTYK